MSRTQSLESKGVQLSRKKETVKNRFAKICSSLTLIILKVNSVALPTTQKSPTEVNDSHRICSKSVDLVFVVVLLEL